MTKYFNGRRSSALTAVLALTICSVACQSPLQAVETSLRVIGTSIMTIQDAVIAGNQEGSISDNDTEAIMNVCRQVIIAGQQATDLTATLATLDAPQKSQVLAIMNPVLASVTDAVQNGTAGIKNQTTKNRVLAALTSLRSTLLTIQAAAGGN